MSSLLGMNNKRIGSISELKFMCLCLSMDISVSIPYGDNDKYDVVIESDGKINRIQIKSCSKVKNGGFEAATSSGAKVKELYKKIDVDIFAIHLITVDVWYIIPVEVINTKTIVLRPNSSKCKYSKYKQAYDLL